MLYRTNDYIARESLETVWTALFVLPILRAITLSALI